MLDVEKNTPPPAARTGVRGSPFYPFKTMDVGDSFLAPFNGREPKRVSSNILSAARDLKPLKFSTRREENGIRVWRIA